MHGSQVCRAVLAATLACGLLPAVAGAGPLPSSVVYVNAAATGANTGASWADALTDLHTAMANAPEGSEVWVAGGTYRPTADADRGVSFPLRLGVAAYGGFAGTETTLAERRPASHPTTLSGDIGTPGDSTDNSYHVVADWGGSGTTAVLDGFRITGGHAAGDPYNDAGAGVIVIGSSPTLRNLVVEGNTAGIGAGVYLALGSATIRDSALVGNTATAAYGSGGGMYVTATSATIANVTATGNTAAYGSGIAIDNLSGSASTLDNVTIAGNTGVGLALTNNSHAVVRSTVIWGNAGGAAYSSNDTPTFIRSVVQGGCPLMATCPSVLDQDPMLRPLATGGAFVPTMAPGRDSVAIDNGDAATCPAADARGMARPQGFGCDMGAYEVRVLTFRSQAAYDGWVLESSETSGVGGSVNATSSTIRVGDDALDRQYRGVVSFNTAALSDTALIVKSMVCLKIASVTGTNPFTNFAGLRADVRTPSFGGSLSLAKSDFSAVASVSSAGLFSPTADAGWHRVMLSSASLRYVSRTSTTQVRVRFTKDDNDDRGADYVSFVSGNSTATASRPILWVYVIP